MDYRPLRDYAAIGDCHGSALVAADGSIDWCCLERMDAEPIFARILDAGHGGHCRLAMSGAQDVAREYLRGTNVLRTHWRGVDGEIAVTDFMPVARARNAGPYDYGRLIAPGWVVRIVEVLAGTPEVQCEFCLTHAFSTERPRLQQREGSVRADAGGTWLVSDLSLRVDGTEASARQRLQAGGRRVLVMGATDPVADLAHIEALLQATLAFWREWSAYSRYEGPYRHAVERSALVLKLLTYAPTGASVAAMTTSLPEEIGGSRNWDYRFCWLRDASLGSHALSALGYAGETRRLHEFVRGLLHRGASDLQVLYGIGGEGDLDERTIPAWDGYRHSKPVRVGNAAHDQRQMDLYGYLFVGARIFDELGGEILDSDRKHLADVAELVARSWNIPDMGLWEIRAEPRHFVHSVAMCWAVAYCARWLLPDQERRWHALADEIWAALCTRGVRDGHFVQSLDETDPRVVDAALLQLPFLGVPIDDRTARATRAAVERELRHGDFVRRYAHRSDGLPGRDGAFLACSFWLVDAMLWDGEQREATALFERLLAYANDVGLFAEEIEPGSQEFLGNFPQGFTHFTLINSAVNLELFRRKGRAALAGDYAARVRRSASAMHGWRSILVHALRAGRRNLFSSRASKWPTHVPCVWRSEAQSSAAPPNV